MPKRTPSGDSRDAGERKLPRVLTRAVLALLALLMAVQYPYVFHVPFISDDYIFLDKTRTVSFASLWGFEHLTLYWYRPWSRELHYWVLQKLAGQSEVAFHLVSIALFFGTLAAFMGYCRSLAGPRVAAIAAVGVVSMSAFAAPFLWIAAVQELWMLMFGMVSMIMLARGRSAVSALALALAVLSKESAAVLPGLALLYLVVVERRRLADAIRRLAPHIVFLAVWAAVHPRLGGRLWSSVRIDLPDTASSSPLEVGTRTVLSLVNLDRWPAPSNDSFWVGALAAIAIVALVGAWVAVDHRRAEALARVDEPGSGRAPAIGHAREPIDQAAHAVLSGRLMLFGTVWALVGWLPLFLPGLKWQAYYGLLGALGAWFGLAVWLARWPAVATSILAIAALLRFAQADTPSRDWGTEFYVKRATSLLRIMREDLQRTHPSFPPHSRLYFTSVPSLVGFTTRGAPVLRVWYDDPTIAGGLFRSYRSRSGDEPAGRDYFFRFDSTTGWVEVATHRESALEQRHDAQWESVHQRLASVMAKAEDWEGTAAQYEILAEAFPSNVEYTLSVGVGYEMLGDSARAAPWYLRVLDHAEAPTDARAFAEQFPIRQQALRASHP